MMPTTSGHECIKGDFTISCVSEYFGDLPLASARGLMSQRRTHFEDFAGEET
jgi:hypothetical protein